jgi:hypothetical protein
MLGAALVLVSAVGATAEPVRVSQSRLVAKFDFESTDASGQKIGRGHQLPRHWYVIGREAGTTAAGFQRQPLHKQLTGESGFPRFTEVGFDAAHATSGEFSFHLGLNSGNAGAFVEVGAVPAVAGSDYLVTAKVRTAALKHSRGYFVTYLVDDDGQRIADSTRRSKPLDTQGNWQTVSLRLAGQFDQAAWVGIELRLMQPTPDAANPLDEQQIVLKDVHGQAWFDDIAVWQLPHIQIGTQSAVNVLRGDQKPRLRCQVRDMTGRQLAAEVRVYDHRMQRVAQQRRRVGAGAANRWRWRPELPGYGWYLAELTVRERRGGDEQTKPIARTVGAFTWLAEAAPLHERDEARFGLVAEGMAAEQLPLLPDVVDQTRLANLVLSAWRADDKATTASERQQRYSNQLKPLILNSERLSMSFTPVPDALAEQVGEEGNHTLRVLSNEPKYWLDYVRAALHWHGQYVKRWQLGATGDDRLFFFPELVETVTTIDRRLKNLVPGPRVVLPWNLHQPPHAALPDSVMYAVDVPPAINARHLDQYLEQWRESKAPYRLIMREPSAKRIAHPQRIRHLVLSMLHAWEADRPTMMLDTPWTAGFERRASLLPDPLLGAFAATAQRLAGRRVVGRMPLGDGLRAMIFDGPRGGMLAVWNQSAPPSRATMNMHLGNAPTAIDVWGNRRTLEADQKGRHTLKVERTPTFITGIDAKLAMFRAGFVLTEPFIRSLQTPHQRKLRLSNPWDTTITGDLRITGPEDWSIQPAQHTFSIPAGETRELPVSLSFPIAEVAGRKRLEAAVSFTAKRRYDVTTGAPMRLGLDNIKFEPTLAIEEQADGTEDAIVNCIITNQGDQRMALYVFANVPGHPRKERLVAQLGAGQSVVRRFQFEGAGGDARRSAVRCGLRETNGPAMLNKRLRLNDAP